MKAIIYFTASRKKTSRQIAQSIDGDMFQLLPGESLPKFFPWKMIKLGHATITNKTLPFAIEKIDYSKYDDIVLIFPIWAGRMSQYMKSFVDSVPFENKSISLIASSGSGNKRYLHKLRELSVPKNKVTDIVLYKGNQIIA